MELLAKLLGGTARVKIMRLFLLNPEEGFDVSDVTERARTQGALTRKTIRDLAALTFIKKTIFIQEYEDANGKISREKVNGWELNELFPYIKELKQLLIEGEFYKHADLAKRFRPAGRVQFLVVSGIFIQNSESRLDLLIVGDNLRRNVIQKVVSVLESELGKELAYAVFETADFKYRVSMYDKLLRDVFDYPHERLIAVKEFSTFALPN